MIITVLHAIRVRSSLVDKNFREMGIECPSDFPRHSKSNVLMRENFALAQKKTISKIEMEETNASANERTSAFWEYAE